MPLTGEREFGPDEMEGVISGLTPGQTYLFEIEGSTKIGSGQVKSWKQKMPIGGLFNKFIYESLVFIRFVDLSFRLLELLCTFILESLNLLPILKLKNFYSNLLLVL